MKIIQVIPDFGLAGAEIMVENLTYGFVESGQDVLVISFYSLHSAITERLEKHGIKIEFLGKNSGFDFSMIAKMRKIFKEYKPEIIHTHRHVLPYVFIASIGLKVGIIHTVHSVAQKEQTPTGIRLNRILFKYFHVVPVALSAEIHKTIKDLYKLPVHKIPVVFNGINLSNCENKESYAKKENFIILHIGRFMDVKNHELLIRSFAQFFKLHQDVRLQLLGDGELKDKMEKLAENLRISEFVEFAGIQSNVYPWLKDADVFILPSKYEGIPMTLIEAMGTGLPIIASNVGGIPDMLTNGKDAILIEPNDTSIIDALTALYSNEEQRRSLGRNAKNTSVKFSALTMAKEYIKIYANSKMRR